MQGESVCVTYGSQCGPLCGKTVFSLDIVELALNVSSVALQELSAVCVTVIFVTRFPLLFLIVWEESCVLY